ncbi:Zn-dependent hydrolase of the beta-lactamase [Colletotrichum truncatum]|uniref:Zn-dependent hydrolase of the beta-lactamase n=1 Tax=Colletotrichum truncatum TaxID=5467 RepID=A0ACC3YR91_COLTU|nr:Zn-dependent hydrolase of the beta-lactamase [Colletotrichum truncatum]KAF6799165.1 Zn-dependent hydrolase of the beta-lactamase [Colletotrichum truncatum]
MRFNTVLLPLAACSVAAELANRNGEESFTGSYKSSLTITHITTATAIFNIDGVNFLTDPTFAPAGTKWDIGIAILTNTAGPALELNQLPVIDAVLLSHEDHPDNLDEVGRRLLDGRRVITTPDGTRKLAPRPGVQAIKPWETVQLTVNGKQFSITGTPCEHLPGGEVTGFIVRTANFGKTNGLPNAIYISGDTIYLEELKKIRKKFHILAAVLNVGNVRIAVSGPPLQITMDGKQAARLFREIGADILVPMHYESWAHFTENEDQLRKVLEEEGVSDKVHWLEPGVPSKIF